MRFVIPEVVIFTREVVPRDGPAAGNVQDHYYCFRHAVALAMGGDDVTCKLGMDDDSDACAICIGDEAEP